MASLTFLLTQQRCTLMTCSLQALIACQNSLKHMFDIWSPDPFCQRLLFVNGCTTLVFFSKAQVWKAPLFPRGSVIPKQMHVEEEMSELKEPNKNDWGPSKILNGFWKIPLTRPDFRLSDSYYSIFVSSVRSSYSHPDLLVITSTTPLFQTTPVLNTGLSLSEPLQLYKGFNDI